MTQSRDVKIECAIAFGHTPGWILTHIGGTQADITRAVARMDAAAAGDNAAYLAALVVDDVAPVDRVEAIATGRIQLPANHCPPEFLEAVKQLASKGLNDPQIGEIVGRTRHAITAFRTRNGIPAGKPCASDDMAWRKIRTPRNRRWVGAA